MRIEEGVRILTWREARTALTEAPTGAQGVNAAQEILDDLFRWPVRTRSYFGADNQVQYLSSAGLSDEGQPEFATTEGS